MENLWRKGYNKVFHFGVYYCTFICQCEINFMKIFRENDFTEIAFTWNRWLVNSSVMNSSLRPNFLDAKPSINLSTEPKLCKLAGLFNSLCNLMKNGTSLKSLLHRLKLLLTRLCPNLKMREKKKLFFSVI